MLKKKLKAPLPTSQRVAAPSRNARKPLRRRDEELEDEVDEVEDELEDEGEEEDEEETRPVRRTNKVVDRRELRRRERAQAPVETEEETEEEVDEETEPEEEEKPRDRKIVRKGARPLVSKGKAGGKRSALVDAFNRAAMAGRGIKAGQHEAILTKLEDFASGDGRVFIRSHYTLCEELEGKNTVVGITMIADGDGEPVWSISLIEEMCAKLGYELERPLSLEDFDQIYEDVQQVRPGCIIDVSYSDKGQQRVGFVDGCENETIEQYRDNLPF